MRVESRSEASVLPISLFLSFLFGIWKVLCVHFLEENLIKLAGKELAHFILKCINIGGRLKQNGEESS